MKLILDNCLIRNCLWIVNLEMSNGKLSNLNACKENEEIEVNKMIILVLMIILLLK